MTFHVPLGGLVLVASYYASLALGGVVHRFSTRNSQEIPKLSTSPEASERPY